MAFAFSDFAGAVTFCVACGLPVTFDRSSIVTASFAPRFVELMSTMPSTRDFFAASRKHAGRSAAAFPRHATAVLFVPAIFTVSFCAVKASTRLSHTGRAASVRGTSSRDVAHPGAASNTASEATTLTEGNTDPKFTTPHAPHRTSGDGVWVWRPQRTTGVSRSP